jgi:hypothetical protein
VRTLRFSIAILAMLAAFAPAQENGVSAGGKWMKYEAEEKMTGYQRVRFELPADNHLENSERTPLVRIYCEKGKLKLADLRPNFRMAGPDRASFWGHPQMRVEVRIDSYHTKHNWNWVNGDFLAMDGDTARELIGAQIFKVEFVSKDGPQIAEFTPAGLDLRQVHQACGLKPEKP